MPLLRKQPFVRKRPPADINPDEEVFCCETTNEIFRDYEEFFNRVIECNSLVWNCGITGRSGLTYQEALESEERARKHLDSFPAYLRRVVLYLASRTKRTRLSDVNDDVFVYVKDRFFKGEIVDAAVAEEEKVMGVKVIKVIQEKTCAPELIVLDSDDSEEEPLRKPTPCVSSENPANFQYVVQLPDGKEFVVMANCVSRKKGLFTRDKCKLFLKQHCESVNGLWTVKSKIAERYKLSEIVYMNYFSSLPPVFPDSFTGKKRATPKKMSAEVEAIKKAKKEKKEQKEKMKKGKEKKKEKNAEEVVEKKRLTAEEREAVKERLRQEKEARKQAMLEERLAKKEEVLQKQREERERRKAELMEERKKRMEEKRQRENMLKEWSKQRDDLECDDLRPLPKSTPVRTCLPSELFGDAIMLLEFTKHFDAVLDMEDHFPDGFDYKTLEQALVDPDTNGPLTDLCEALLSTIISLQDEEEAEEGELNLGEEETTVAVDDSSSNKTVSQLIQDATLASQWPQLHQGMPLKKLTFDSMTLTEILRLHFLSSGARGNARSIKFRYQQRGGYSSLDDAGLELKISEPELLKAFCTTSIFDMTPADKLKILTALSHQILTYAASRDLIDDVYEKLKQAKMELRHIQWAENQREREEAAARYKKRLEERAKEKAREEEKRAQRKKEMEEKLKKEGAGDENKIQVDGVATDQSTEKSELKRSKKEADAPPVEPTVRTRHKAAEEDELMNLIQEGSYDIDESTLSPEDLKLLKQRRAEKEAERKTAYHERENEYLEEIVKLHNGFNILPLGQDRAFRRFWVFESIPGVFVEAVSEHLPESLLEPVHQMAPPVLVKEGEEKSTASDKENESFDGSEIKNNATLNLKSDNPLSAANSNTDIVAMETDNSIGVEKMDTDEKTCDTLLDSIVPERNVSWSYYSTTEEVEQLIESLNPRGFRECALKQTLQELKSWIQQALVDVPSDFLQASVVDGEATEKNTATIKSVKSRNREVKGKVKNASAKEFMELNLREMLLDMEERIYAGSLGAIKVKNRAQWREAIENGSYSAQCDGLTWSGQTEEVKETSADDEELETEDEELSQLVKDLSRALLQIQQGIEPRFLSTPLGETETVKKARQKATVKADKKDHDSKKSSKKPKEEEDEEKPEDKGDKEVPARPSKTVLERWEESLMKCTSLSQVFLHLSTLDTSIIWSKSVLNARCKICKRQSYADQMLLCDGCDRGHHMFCLKPPVKKIPQGEWYCPECRPKETRKASPRKKRKSFADNLDDSSDEDEDEDEESSEEEDDDDESEDSSENDDSEENEEEDSEVDREESPKPTKISLKGMRDKLLPKSGRSTPNSVRSSSRSKSSPVNTTRSNSQAANKRQTTELSTSRPSSRAASKRQSIEPSTSRPNSRAGKRGHSSDDEAEAKQTTKSRGSDTSHSMKMMEKLVYEIVDHEDSWLFLKPVSKRDAPDYFDIIKSPMDLSTIRANINAFRYNGPLDIAEDMRLMFSNCEAYNVPSAEEYKLGSKLSKLFEKRIKELKIDLKSSKQDFTAKDSDVPSKRPRRK